MMLYQAGRGIDPGKIYVRLNPGNDDGEFAVIELPGTGGAALFIKSAAEADALIKAAVEAKRLLMPPGEGGVLFPAGDEDALPSPRPADRCECGHIALNHHLNQVASELQYCNECPGVDDCAAFSPAEPASVTA